MGVDIGRATTRVLPAALRLPRPYYTIRCQGSSDFRFVVGPFQEPIIFLPEMSSNRPVLLIGLFSIILKSGAFCIC